MGDEFKSIRESLLRSLLSGINNGNGGGERSGVDSANARDLLVTLLSRAGKGKDEIVQILAREIGIAVAAMLRKPLSELTRNQKLQVTFEFVEKNGSDEPSPDSQRKTPKKKAPPKKKPARKKPARRAK